MGKRTAQKDITIDTTSDKAAITKQPEAIPRHQDGKKRHTHVQTNTCTKSKKEQLTVYQAIGILNQTQKPGQRAKKDFKR